jgi:hypothetical protein
MYVAQREAPQVVIEVTFTFCELLQQRGFFDGACS